MMFDNSPEDLRCGVLLGFLEANAGRRAALLSPEARKASVLADFAASSGRVPQRRASTSSTTGRRTSGRAAATAVA